MRFLLGAFGVMLLLQADALQASDDLRERLKDDNGVLTEWWVYNDIPAAMAEARRLNKPLFVTFRCVPCKDCAAFDADVANGNERVRDFAQQNFISVRQVEMKGVNLSLFQFDHDLNWAGGFINGDGVVYARYGTQSSEGSDAYNSIDGLMNTMQRVLALHANYPENREQLAGKRGSAPAWTTALEMPGLKNPAKYAQQTTRGNCIHCHNIHDAQHQQALEAGTYTPELLYKYPPPDNIGLKIDRISGIRIASVAEGSPAAAAGISTGEDIIRMQGQPICSIADIQWVLHHLPGGATTVSVETSKSGTHQLQLNDGWRKYDFSWRGSMWNTPPRLQVYLPELTGDPLKRLKLPDGDGALEVRWISPDAAGGKQAIAAGLREKDIVIACDGQPIRMTSRQFNAYLRLNHKVGDTLHLTVLRDRVKLELQIPLVE
ncbi:MAG: PDZ domain-containing protein [Planctomycetaceae bacterium]|nr:PDZ domain-containing protein [Planctomycetaceae bacterium]